VQPLTLEPGCSMARRDENHGLPSLRYEVEGFFSQALGGARVSGGASARALPSLDLYEEPGRYVVELDMPGVRLQDLDIFITGRRLTLSGRREVVRELSGSRIRVHERWSGSFSRSIELPGPVDEERMTATLQEGILRIELPRREDRR
jgi:HSP20 family protein